MTRFGELVSDPDFCKEMGNITSMTVWRWDRDPALIGRMPVRIKIRNRNYRSRVEIDNFKSWLLSSATKARSESGAKVAEA